MRLRQIFIRLTRSESLLGLLGRIIVWCALVLSLDIGRYFFWPRMTPLLSENPVSTSFIEYRKAQWARSGSDIELEMIWRDYAVTSPYLRLAVTIAEDDLFWDHHGFDWKGMREAMEWNLAQGRLAAGGSTITQQLVKNLYFTPERSILRKIKEAIVAWRMERSLSKERILELYLNVVEWGPGIFGAEAAARHYYRQSARSFTIMQAASLASMLPAPLLRTPESAFVQRKARGIVRTMNRRGVR